MDLYFQLHGDLSRSSKSQARKGMLADWTKLSCKPVVALYYNKWELKNRIAIMRSRSIELHDQTDALEKEKQTLLSKNIYLQKRVVELESSAERDRKEHLILQEVVSRVCGEPECPPPHIWGLFQHLFVSVLFLFISFFLFDSLLDTESSMVISTGYLQPSLKF